MYAAGADRPGNSMAQTDREERFRVIYDDYSGLILAYAARRTSEPADAADVVAETFTVAWRRIDDVPDGEEARPWLYGVARKILANHHRAGRRRRRLSERVTAMVGGHIESSLTVVDGPDAETINEAFDQLSDDDRELLRLVGWDGLPRDEIAEIVGASRAVVRLRLHRARKRFEKALEEVGVKRLEASGHGPGGWANARPDLEEA